ncbi:MAG: AMP-binding protein, partial [Umezawaea sp.]
MSVPTVGSARVVTDLPFVAAQVHRDRVAWRYREHDAWQQKTFTEVAEAVGELASGFARAGVQTGDRVAVLAETRYEWSVAGLAVLAAGGIVVPIYASSSPEECAYIVENSGAVLLVAENGAQAGKIDLAALPDLREVLVIDADAEHRTTAELAEEGRANPAGDELEARRAGTSPDDPSVIIYTSGTTGPPKGCV